MTGKQKKKNLFYYAIGVLVVFCLVFGIGCAAFLSQPLNLGLMANSGDQTVEDTPIPTPDINVNATKPDISATNTSQAPIKPVYGSGLLTEEEALKIAIPLIDQYAMQNNRVIASVNSSFCPYVRDINGSRTDHPSPSEPITDLNETSFYPQWCVKAFFESTNDSLATGHVPSSTEGSVYGYCVLVWADNGQIRSTCPLARME